MDDLLNLAAQNLPNLMSMLGMFIQEKRHQKNLNHQEFLDWLDNHRFEELKKIILATHGIEREIDTLLKAQQSEVLNELAVISRTVSKIASGMEILGAVSQIVSPKVSLSQQALDLLDLLSQKAASCPLMHIMMEATTQGRVPSILMNSTQYKVIHPQFLREDLAELQHAGFIMAHEYTHGGEPMYGITRHGAEYVKTLRELTPNGAEG